MTDVCIKQSLKKVMFIDKLPLANWKNVWIGWARFLKSEDWDHNQGGCSQKNIEGATQSMMCHNIYASLLLICPSKNKRGSPLPRHPLVRPPCHKRYQLCSTCRRCSAQLPIGHFLSFKYHSTLDKFGGVISWWNFNRLQFLQVLELLFLIISPTHSQSGTNWWPQLVIGDRLWQK